MRFWPGPFIAAALIGLLAAPAAAQDKVWTAVIPQAFAGNVYTWHLKADGGYLEDGRNAASGAAVQSTLSGHWCLTGRHMVLHQDGIDYVFDGDIVGDEYLGVVYLDGKRLSRFCALRGETPPKSCAAISA